MSNMLEAFVKNEMSALVKTEYPHLEYPTCVCAKITRVTNYGEKYKYNLKILDKNMRINNEFPEIPNIVSTQELGRDDVVVIARLYGGTAYYILGRYDT